jgi:hypothetical protein
MWPAISGMSTGMNSLANFRAQIINRWPFMSLYVSLYFLSLLGFISSLPSLLGTKGYVVVVVVCRRQQELTLLETDELQQIWEKAHN